MADKIFSFSGLHKVIDDELTPFGPDKINALELRTVLHQMVYSFEAYLSTKAGLTVSTSAYETGTLATGNESKLIAQVISNSITIFIYNPAATPKLTTFFTFNQ